jgi:hypothetical protein
LLPRRTFPSRFWSSIKLFSGRVCPPGNSMATAY